MFALSRFVSYTLIGWVTLQVLSAAARATVNIPQEIAAEMTVLQMDSIEVCHRQGGTPETCGDLMLD